MRPGRYDLFVRVRAETCGEHVGATGGWFYGGHGSQSALRTIGATRYTWLKLGRIQRTTQKQFLYVDVFKIRSTRGVRIDEIYVSPRV